MSGSFQDLLAHPSCSTRNQTWWANLAKQVRTPEEFKKTEPNSVFWVFIKERSSFCNAFLFVVCFALDKVNNLKQSDKLTILKPKMPPATAKPTKQERRQTTTFAPTTPGTKTFFIFR